VIGPLCPEITMLTIATSDVRQDKEWRTVAHKTVIIWDDAFTLVFMLFLMLHYFVRLMCHGDVDRGGGKQIL